MQWRDIHQLDIIYQTVILTSMMEFISKHHQNLNSYVWFENMDMTWGLSSMKVVEAQSTRF